MEGFYGFVVVAAVSGREHEVWEGTCGGIQGKLEMGDYGVTYDHNTLYAYRKFSKKNKRYIKEKNECVFIIIDFQSFRNPCNVEILLNSLGFYISIYSLKFPEVSASLQSEPVNLKQALCQPLALLCKARQLQVFKPTNMKEQIIAEGNGKPQARSTVVGNKVVMYEKDPLAILKCSSLRAKCRSAEIAAIETFQH